MVDTNEFVGDGKRMLPQDLPEVTLTDDDVFAVSTGAFEEQFDESILQTIKVENWRLGSDVNAEFRRIAFEVREAARFETDSEKQIREQVFPRMAKSQYMPKNAGLHIAERDNIESVHRGLLFNGGVEACDGIVQIHDTLPLTIYQIGVSLVSYQGAQGHYGQRLFRHDLRQKGVDIPEIIEFLERRDRRDSSMRPPGSDRIGELVQKAILDYAERAILLRRSNAVWRMGHGNPVTYELLTGGNNLDLMVHATGLLREMIEDHQKFVYIASEPRDILLHTFGQALRPSEYAIVGTLEDRLKTWLHQARFKIGVSTELDWNGEMIRPAEWIPRFIREVASKVVVGLFRTTLMAPAQVFYAHEDHSEIAAHIAIADSMLQEQGTPMLLQTANHLCNAVYGDSLAALVEQSYVAAGLITVTMLGDLIEFSERGLIMAETNNNGSLPVKKTDSGPADGPIDLLDFRKRLDADIQSAGGEIAPDPFVKGAIGTTMFDLPGSEDNTITVLLSQENAHALPSQALVRIKSRKGDNVKQYLGIVSAGPFAEPDSLRGDSHMLVTVATRGGRYEPPYHGRVQLTILGEELANGSLCPPRLRPLPNSPVFALSEEESTKVLKASGDIRMGCVVGYEKVIVGVPSDKKFVLPRHTAILGTTGGGKSTTVARFVQQAQATGMAVILLDVEGEYTHLHEPTTNVDMLAALEERGLKERGLPQGVMTLYHLVGRETANPDHPAVKPFSLQFARLSPYTAAEILGLTEPQQQRFMQAYDIAKEVLRDLGIFPEFKDENQERIAMEIDEFERGYPRLTLTMMMDVVGACRRMVENAKEEKGEKGAKGEKVEKVAEFEPKDGQLATPKGKETLKKKIHAAGRLDSPVSWRALLGRLGRLERLKVFDSPSPSGGPLNYKNLLKPGSVSIIDLSDSGMSELTNIVISDMLRGVQEAQDEAYQKYEKAKKENSGAPTPTRTVIIIEEAHEFLNSDRIEKMKILFQQVARIAKRGRKRWLGLAFVTQLPQHLPPQVFGLVNSYILHKITDSDVVSKLRRTVSGIDEGLWNRLSGLAPGQAIASFPHMARPLLVSIDPTPCELRLVD